VFGELASHEGRGGTCVASAWDCRVAGDGARCTYEYMGVTAQGTCVSDNARYSVCVVHANQCSSALAGYGDPYADFAILPCSFDGGATAQGACNVWGCVARANQCSSVGEGKACSFDGGTTAQVPAPLVGRV